MKKNAKNVKNMENMENAKKDRKCKISKKLTQIWKRKSNKETLSSWLIIADKKRII